jgi:septal ring factor EnvC (AmiA/AmiB activator)
MHTAVLDERLKEAERKQNNGEITARELERRLNRTELDTNKTAERTRDHGTRLDALGGQMTAMTQSLHNEHDRRWSQLEEQLAAHAQRGFDDRAQIEEIIEEVRRSGMQRSARLESLLTTMANKLEASADDTAGRVHALASEVARLSYDLRAEVGQALTKNGHAAKPMVDLTEHTPTTVDLR